MNVGDIPLFAMLRQRLGYLGDRQKLIAQNIANAETPGFKPQDVGAFTFKVGGATGGALSMMQPSQTKAGHLPGKPMKSVGAGGAKVSKMADTETTLDGNSVVLEDQMIKLTETRMQYDAAIGFYQKSMGLLRMAARPPSR